jgi:hypothetical protein
MKRILRSVPCLLPVLPVLALTACGSGGGYLAPGPKPSATSYDVGGYVAGLTGSGLSLSYNGGAAAAISRNGAFTSATGVSTGTAYSVTVVSQPTNPAQTCTVSNGSGAVASANVTSISVYCPQAVGAWALVATAGSITTTPGGVSVPGSLSIYAIDPNSGALGGVAVSTVSTGPAIATVQLVPDSLSVWALSIGEPQADDQNTLSSVYVYAVNDNTGVLTANPAAPFFTLDGTASTPPGCPPGLTGAGSTQAISFAPSGMFGYAANEASMPGNNEGTWVFTLASGAPAALGSAVSQACGTPVTVDPSGQFAYYAIAVADNTPTMNSCCVHELVASTVNSTTGGLTSVPGTSPLSIGGGQGPAVTDPFGRFVYVLDGDVIWAFTIDSASGALTPITGSPFAFPSDSLSMAIAPDGQFAYIAATDGLYTYSIDASTGALSEVGSPVALQIGPDPLSAVVDPSILQIDPSGQFAYVSASAGAGVQGIYAYAIDATTGALTEVSGSPFAITTQGVPLETAVID